MKINNILLPLLLAVFVIGCGPSKDEAKRLSARERARLRTLDSLAFKVGVQPSLDCLPVFVAKEEHLGKYGNCLLMYDPKQGSQAHG